MQTHFPSLRLRDANIPTWVLVYSFAAVFAGAVHLSLGAGFVVLLCVASVLVSIVPAAVFGWRDMPSLIALLIGFRYAASALFWKLAEYDALDHGLYAPVPSFTVVLLGTFAVALAALASHSIWKAPPKFQEQYSSRGIRLLLGVGVSLTVAGIIFHQVGIELPGGIAALIQRSWPLVPIAWLALNLRRQGSPITVGVILAGIVTMVASLGLNSRGTTLSFVLSVVVFVICHRLKIRPIFTLSIGLFMVLFLAIIVPVMSDPEVRGIRADTDLVTLTVVTLEKIGDRLSGEAPESLGAPRSNYIVNYISSNNDFFTRMVNIQQLDIIVALAYQQGVLGTDRLRRGILELLPSVFVTKSESSLVADYAFWVYGEFAWGDDSYTETTAFGDAYVYGGYWFVLLSMFPCYLALFIFFRLACPRFEMSIFAAYIIATYMIYVTASTVLSLISLLVRELPFIFALFWLASRTSFTRPLTVSNLMRGGDRRGVSAPRTLGRSD